MGKSLPAGRRFWTVLAILCWVGAFLATHIPLDHMPSAAPSDKTLHLLGYGGLASVWLIALAKRSWPLARRALVLLLVLPIYGALDELTQPIVNRHASVLDWVYDLIGIAVATAIHLGICLLAARREVQSA